ncbi:MAG: FAD-dependent oxidoreductase, partial [Myxococcota bacterium]
LLAPWEGRFGTFEGDAFRARAMEAYVGVPGMNALARHLAADLDVRVGRRVTRLARGAAGWTPALEEGPELGPFDRVVLAVPAAQAAPLLGDHPFAARAAEVRVDASLTAMVAYPAALGLPFDAARDAAGGLAWMARETSKPGRPGLGDGGLEAWTLQAGPALSAAELELDKAAIAERLHGLFAERVATLGLSVPEPALAMGHRWRFAQTRAPLGEACLWDGAEGLGVCGDWCLGDRLEHAFRSGRAMAGRLLGAG